MKRFYALTLMALMLASCADTGAVAPKEGRMSIGNQFNQPITEDGTLSIGPSETVKNWSALYGNERNNRPHVKMGSSPKMVKSVSVGEGVSDHVMSLAGPIVAGTTIYTLDGDFSLQATDLKTAKVLWRKKLADVQGTSAKSIGLTRNKDRLYAVAGNGLIVSLDFTGEEIWRKDLKAILRSSATVDNGKLYVSSVDNHFFVLNTNNGNTLWQYEEEASVTNFFGVGTPAVYRSSVIAPTTNGRVNAFDAETGVLLWTDNLWTTRTNNPLLDITQITAAPIIDNTTVYVVGNAGRTTAYRLVDGMPIFSVDVGGRETPIISGETLFLLTNKNKLVALNKRKGSQYWEADLSQFGSDRTWFSPVLVNGEIMLTSTNGDILFFNAKTGKKTRQEQQEKLIGAPVFAKDTMLLLTAKGDMLFYQ